MTSSVDAFVPWSPSDDARPAPPPSAPSAWALAVLEQGAGRGLGIESDPLRDAYRRGFEEGCQEGERASRAALAPVLVALTTAAGTIAESHDAFARASERNLEALALAVARHLVGREVASDPLLVRELVERALLLMPPERPIEVRLNPADLDVTREALDPDGGDAPATLRWTADPALARGECIVESPTRIVDGRTDVSLRLLYERFDRD